jgi:hypothetical protein
MSVFMFSESGPNRLHAIADAHDTRGAERLEPCFVEVGCHRIQRYEHTRERRPQFNARWTLRRFHLDDSFYLTLG